jgi:hypothetical protein
VRERNPLSEIIEPRVCGVEITRLDRRTVDHPYCVGLSQPAGCRVEKPHPWISCSTPIVIMDYSTEYFSSNDSSFLV